MVDEAVLMRTLEDRTRPVPERAAAAEGLGISEGSNYEVWRLLCGVFQDPDEETEVRIAAAQALSRRNRAAAPNQLCRYLEGDEDRRLRAYVVEILAQMGSVPDSQEPLLQRDLDALRSHMAPIPLANLALSYGSDPRMVATLTQALHHADPEVRESAVGGLGMLGMMAEVAQALRDDAPEVRAAAAETLGYYSLKTPEDLAALGSALEDTDLKVQRAAKTALRRLGVQPTPKPRQHAKAPSLASGQLPGTKVRAGSALSTYEWKPFLQRWSQQWLSVSEYAVELPDEVIEAAWLGYPGATEHQLNELEQRLGRTVPPSYRTFLRVTNGWRRTSPFIERLWSSAEVDHFHMRNQEWIDILLRDAGDVTPEQHACYDDDQGVAIYRAEYLREAVEVSDVGDAAVYLLNPAVVTSEGEWEAWFLASWAPGIRRYRSFWDLMQAEYASFVELEKPNE